jgi:lipoprotein-anchoring transpeptidase ErfK/SrfK
VNPDEAASGKGHRVIRYRSIRVRVLQASVAMATCLASFGGAASAYAVEPPGQPAWVSPAGGYAASTAAVTLVAGSSTTSVTVVFNGVPLGVQDCAPGATLSFGRIAMPAGVSSLVAITSNGGVTATFEYRVRRIEHPWATCIIIDKSDFRLYWIRGGELVKSYPIAIGKRNSQTPNGVWKVLSKERTPAKGVYGPRKLRLYRRVTYRTRHGRSAYGYKRTAYGVHGTNQPWVIGTQASHGCIRLNNSQILDLWPRVPLGTLVLTRQ